jgi:hypothetical protein
VARGNGTGKRQGPGDADEHERDVGEGHVEERFSPHAMADGYERVYAALGSRLNTRESSLVH